MDYSFQSTEFRVQLMCRRSRQFFYKSNKSVVFRGNLWYNISKEILHIVGARI